jgi:hypothetical protein
MKSRFLVLAAVAALCSTSAFADIVTETYTGTASGSDAAGLFGTPGANITGNAFTAVYVFDTNLVSVRRGQFHAVLRDGNAH